MEENATFQMENPLVRNSAVNSADIIVEDETELVEISVDAIAKGQAEARRMRNNYMTLLKGHSESVSSVAFSPDQW